MRAKLLCVGSHKHERYEGFHERVEFTPTSMMYLPAALK